MPRSSSSPKTWTLVQICGAISLVCSAWNLLGDLYYLDFYTAHLSFDDFGQIRSEVQGGGYLFAMTKGHWWVVFAAQSGGWMYPIWAMVTVGPLYLGLTGAGEVSVWRTVAPCALMMYGLSVVGGALHNAAAFVTVLPSVYHYNDWSDSLDSQSFSLFLEQSQAKIIQHVGFGCLPGYLACNAVGLWVAVLVQSGNTMFPKSFHWFNPFVTMIWVQILSAILPDTVGFYLVGCLGTWWLMIFNFGITYYLWNTSSAPKLESLSANLLLHKGQATPARGSTSPVQTTYNTIQDSSMQ